MKESILNLLRVEKKYRDPEYSQRQLADDLGISVYALSRTMQQLFGLRYMELIHKWRIQDAARYLRGQRKQHYTVDDIGVLVGFRNRQSFFSAFKKETGITPEQYRLKNAARKQS
jgi:AraC-like DNA-binding protein